MLGRLLFWGMIFSFSCSTLITAWAAVEWVNRPFAGFMVTTRMFADFIGPPNWTGAQAGVQFPDKILRANGKILGTIQDLKKVTAEVPVGEPITYTIEREGKVLEVAVPTMIFTWVDFIIQFGFTIFVGLMYIIPGVVVFCMKPDTSVSWLFLVVAFNSSMNNIVTIGAFSGLAGFHRVRIFFEAIIPAFIVHLSLVFPEKWKITKKLYSLLSTAYIFSAILLIGMELSYPGPWFTSLWRLSGLYSTFAIAAFMTAVFVSYVRKGSILAKTRAKVLFFGAALSFPIPVMLPLISAWGGSLGGFPVIFGQLPAIIFPVSIAYAIAKHNLFDVDVYIKRTVGYVLMTVIVAMVYFSMQTLISTVVLQPLLGEAAEKVYPILFAILVVFLFNPVNITVQDAVDKMFFRKKFDYKEMVASVSNALTSLLNMDEIIKQVIHTVRKQMFIDTAGVVILDPKKKMSQSFFVRDESVRLNDLGPDISIGNDDPLLTLLSREKKLVTKYDIAEDPRYADVKVSCGQRFSEMGASLAIPLIYQDEVKGMLALGYKKSGHFYSREDIDLLTTLANQGAVAIENAKMAEQMKKEETVRTNLARYLSPQIVDQIIQKDMKVNLGGDRKVVTVLFSDIRNFTTITETRPPDQLVQILNDYFTEMAGIIFENQGSLDKYIGDAIVAVFGSLIPLENSAARAVTASIEMMKRLPFLNEQWMKKYGFTINIGIGLNTGEVFLGNIGSPERMEFTVIGDTVNVASRFSGLAKAGQILMTKETFACLGPDIKYKELPPSEVKGKTGKLEVFEVLSE